MTTATAGFAPSRSPALPPRKKALENEVLGISVFIISELMFFTALISAYLVIKAATGNTWVPPANIRLPILTTGLNTAVLIVSGILTWQAGRLFQAGAARQQVGKLYGTAIGLGLVFLAVQGYEWFKLLSLGMTLTTDVFSSIFYLIIGAHGLHVFGAVVAMLLVFRNLLQGRLTQPGFQAMRMFWYFVVGIWPVLYGLVYF